MNAPRLAVLMTAGWVLSFSYAAIYRHPLSWVGYLCFAAAVVALLSCFVSWWQVAVHVAAFFLRGAPRAQAMGAAAMPHVQAAGQAVGRGAQGFWQKAVAWTRRRRRFAWAVARVTAWYAKANPSATVGILLFMLSTGFFFLRQFEAGILVFLAGIGSLIAHYKGTQTFARNWKEYWLALSVVGVIYTITFGYGWGTIAVWTVSAGLAALVLVCGVKGVRQGLKTFLAWALKKLAEGVVWAVATLGMFLFNLLSGKWGWSKASLGGSVIAFCFGLAGLMRPGLMEQSRAELLMVASVILFIASMWIGTNETAKKHPIVK